MPFYEDLTQQVGDNMTEAMERMQGLQLDLVRTVIERVERFVPSLPSALAERLPTPASIVRANYALAQRLLDAQRAHSLELATALTPEREAADTRTD